MTKTPTIVEESSARHSRGAQRSTASIAWRFVVRLKWQYLPLLLSDYTREILRRKYDAVATDMAYENRASGAAGPLGKLVDRLVLNFPTHEGLRQRLAIVQGSLKKEITQRLQQSDGPVRVLSAPCGLMRDVLGCVTELRKEPALDMTRVDIYGLDLDASGEVLPEAGRRAEACGVAVRLYQDDLFKPQAFQEVLEQGVRFQVVNCIGLTPWLDLAEVRQLMSFFHDRVLEPGGMLIIDNFSPHKYAALAKDLEIYSRYHDAAAFVDMLRECGFRMEKAVATANHVNTVHIATAIANS
ncbi:MAG: class I SAM-dependent methyltransferase family protein [Chloroflexi bacterium]|nr:class I SAM-dependent methyltransferase family protein [Chloroflexota bacterium]